MGKKTRKKLLLCQADAAYLKAIISKRSSSQVTVQRATILLMYSSEEKITHIAKKLKTNRPLVERCIDKALAFGIKIALKDLPR
ncbi:helix-turn-helix domain-containing protein, partial [Candidatus Dependentiae bacterium]|nr:helix-turn-helix domain-containing protein [Candidatus Dependentiae bacterium]